MATFKNVIINDTGSIKMPTGTTAQRPGSPSNGDVRFNTDLGIVELWDGGTSRWINAITGYPVVIASGGIEVEVHQRDMMYRAHIFESSGTLTVTGGGDMEYLMVGGGGGGGMDMGGGGGGGGVLSGTTAINSNQTITVGAGGYGAPSGNGGYRTDGVGPQPAVHNFTINGTNGGNTTAFGYTAIGGGYGGTSYRTSPLGGIPNSGGSGGGASGYNNGNGTPRPGGAGTAGQGNDGGAMGTNYYSGGGGGAGTAGVSGNSRPDGGWGKSSNMLGITYYWGGGGGGASYSLSSGGTGGVGGGGAGAVGDVVGGSGYNYGGSNEGGSASSQTNTMGGDGGKNTGGGGGGGSHYNNTNKGGEGGSGIVIVRYPLIHTQYEHAYEEMTWINNNNSAILFNTYTTAVVQPAIAKTANGWDGKAYLDAGFTAPFTLEWNKSANPDGSNDNTAYGMIGFKSGSGTPNNNSYTDLEYAAYPYRLASVRFYRSGTSQGDNGGAWGAGDKHRLVYGTDGWVRYYIGSSTRHAYNHGNATTVFYPQVALYMPGSSAGAKHGSFRNIRVIRAAWNGSNYVS